MSNFTSPTVNTVGDTAKGIRAYVVKVKLVDGKTATVSYDRYQYGDAVKFPESAEAAAMNGYVAVAVKVGEAAILSHSVTVVANS